MKKILVLFGFVTIAFLSGCSSSPTSPSNNNNNNNPTNSTDYLPLTTGNSWTYTGAAGSYTVSVIGDTTFGGYTWKLTTNTALAGANGVMRKEGSIYYGVNPPGYTGPPGIVTALNETPGSTWSWNINTGTSVNQYVFTNAAQGLTRIVLGKSYSNVIDIRMDYTFNIPGYPPVTGTFHYYYAQGIGLIDSDLGASGDEPLSSYTLK